MTLDPLLHSAPVLLRHLPEGPLVGVEVGVLRGVNAAALLDGRPELLLYCVDNWCHGGLVAESPAKIRWQAHNRLGGEYASRVVWQEMGSLGAALSHARHSFDFVHLDSSHEPEHLWQEIAEWRSRVKPGGLLCGHDYGHPDFPGVREAVDRAFLSPVLVEEYTWITTV